MTIGRRLKRYEAYMHGKYEHSGTIYELSEIYNIAPPTLRKRVFKEMSGLRLIEIEQAPRIYALYQGEGTPLIGTLEEIQVLTGLETNSLLWYKSPEAKRRGDIVLIELEEDDEMRVKRTNDKYAPILTEEKYEPVKKEKIYISKTVEPAEFKVGRYAQSLHDSYFRKWSDVK